MQVRNRSDRWLAGAFVAALTLSMSPAHGQTTPKIQFLFPPGAQRGTEVDVEFRGEYMPEGCLLSSAQAGLVLRPSGVGGRYHFTIAADSVAGPREIRLSSVQGASAPFPFLIGELPEINHSDADEPRDLTFPVTANGRLDAKGDIDEYFVTLSAGSGSSGGRTASRKRAPSALKPFVRPSIQCFVYWIPMATDWQPVVRTARLMPCWSFVRRKRDATDFRCSTFRWQAVPGTSIDSR